MPGYTIAICLLVSVATVLSTSPHSEPTSPHSNNLVGTLDAVIYSLKELNPLSNSNLKLVIIDEAWEISELLRRATGNINSDFYLLHNLTLEATCQWVSWNLMHE